MPPLTRPNPNPKVDRPHVMVFLSVALVLHHKEEIMDGDEDSLLQLLSLLRFSSTDELDQVWLLKRRPPNCSS